MRCSFYQINTFDLFSFLKETQTFWGYIFFESHRAVIIDTNIGFKGNSLIFVPKVDSGWNFGLKLDFVAHDCRSHSPLPRWKVLINHIWRTIEQITMVPTADPKWKSLFFFYKYIPNFWAFLNIMFNFKIKKKSLNLRTKYAIFLLLYTFYTWDREMRSLKIKIIEPSPK